MVENKKKKSILYPVLYLVFLVLYVCSNSEWRLILFLFFDFLLMSALVKIGKEKNKNETK